MIHAGLMTARLQGYFCVFFIGMRINMPPFGLGRVGTLSEIGGKYHTAGGRMGE